MILTYKIKHNRDFSDELKKARLVAEFALKNRTISSKDVSCFCLKSVISNQVLRKYSKNRKIKRVSRVPLIIPSQGVRIKDGNIWISSLKLTLKPRFQFEKINQIELDKVYAYVSVSVPEEPIYEVYSYLGIDLNVKGYGVVVSNGKKIKKYGKNITHIKQKARKERAKWSRLGLKKKVAASGNKEKRRTKDVLHKISRAVVNLALEEKQGIRMENLKGIRKKHWDKEYSGSLNNWPFHMFRNMIEYKAKLLGVPVEFIAPQFSSQTCSKCGKLGDRDKKSFVCSCGHRENADANAAFNVASLKHLAPVCIQPEIKRAKQEGNLAPLISLPTVSCGTVAA
jgi:putative transposase